MPKYLQIQIPKACHENWDKMDAAAQGKFCISCQKNVIDFTLMDDNDLANFFKKNTANVCGRFNNGQLNTDIQIPAKKIPWLKYFFQITIPAFLFSLKGTAQANEIKGKVVCVETIQSHTVGEIRIDTSKPVSKVITGVVLDNQGKPVPYASVTVKNLRHGTATDSNGKFTINLPNSNPVLVISAVGYTTQEISCASGPDSNIIVINPHILPVVTVGYSVVTRKKKKSFSSPALFNRNSILSNPFSIYPNPIASNSKLNIKWKNDISSDQSIEIYNQTGNLLQQEITRINKKTNQQNIDLKQLPPGAYVIKITDSKTRKSSSQQFIVE